MKVLKEPTLSNEGFKVLGLEQYMSSQLVELQEDVYSKLEPGQNAANKLCRGIRWGQYTSDGFTWLDRDTYSLPEDLNHEEKGRVRRFQLIDKSFLSLPEVEEMFHLIFEQWDFAERPSHRAYEIQLSAIRYEPNLYDNGVAIPSPIYPHQDLIDGAIIVLNRKGNFMGGVSRIYSLDDEPLYEFDLQVGEALLVKDQMVKHQVTPLLVSPQDDWRPNHRAYRDILIVRFQPVGR